MSVFIIRRFLQSIAVIVAMSVIVFFGVNVIGNPVDILINPEFDQEEMERATRALGLDLPLWQQYLVFVRNALRGDLGKSFVFGEPALTLIVQRMPATLELAFTALFMAILIGIPLGLFAGLKPTSSVAQTIMGGSILGFSSTTESPTMSSGSLTVSGSPTALAVSSPAPAPCPRSSPRPASGR